MLRALGACRCRLFLFVLLLGLGLIKSIKVAEARRKKLQRNLLVSSCKILRLLSMLIVASDYSVRGNNLKSISEFRSGGTSLGICTRQLGRHGQSVAML
uniref:Putative secreted protein n=1 Tax=Ixodes ricinus TaxID=34613 RepID=A0A147BNI5_IXORI